MLDTKNTVPYIPEDAPFSGEQRQWLGGFLAGLHSRLAMGAGPIAPSSQATKTKPLDIIFGTQTGNAESVAEDAAALAKAKGFTPRVAEMDEIDMAQISTMQNLIIVLSTYGEGEMPDNAHQFWEALTSSTAPRLEQLNYGVLALGDTSYDEFCHAGKLVDTRLEQLGAKRLVARVDCDVDFEDAAEAWIATAIHDADTVSSGPAEVVAKKAKAGWGRKNPYTSTILENRVLSAADSAKEIRHIAFDLGDSGLTYEAGDALGVMPVNSPDIVEAWLTRLRISAETEIGGTPIGHLLKHQLEIVTPSRDLIRVIEPMAQHDELSHVTGNGDKEALENFLWGKDALDLLNLNDGLDFDAAQIVAALKPLQHRAYSISSSPNAHAGEVHLTVAAVRWMHGARLHKGVCSTFLADYAPEAATAGIFMSPNKSFRVPEDDSVPMIMVGPGTGVAPFRAFLEERRARGANGANWLFFGDQHRGSDFIYEDEIATFSSDGLLARLDLAFSRDQADKIYVQHRMMENGKDLFAQLEEGGYFYVCGDATHMAKDVDAALHSIIETQGGMTPEAATEYVNRLKREKRYLRDVY
jgi:sulfite reductase (NADPH) flavoprotein alpha-component